MIKTFIKNNKERIVNHAVEDHWWYHCSTVKRYMPKQNKKSCKDMIKELDILKKQGYQAIQITAPYQSTGFEPWWGLRAFDYFSPDSHLADSMEEFTAMVEAVHNRGMKVMLFLNLGYGDVKSDIWKKACKDKKNGVESPEKNYFCWSETDKKCLEKGQTGHFKQGGRWVWSKEAGAYYWSYWSDGKIAEPQYDWSNQVYQSFAKKILHHWLKTGIDGVIVDAVNWYLNCDWEIIKSCVTDIVHQYPDVCCIPEGSTGYQEDWLSWISKGGFDLIEDQTFDSDLAWNGSAIMDAIESGDASRLTEGLSVCSKARKKNVPAWTYLSYDKTKWTPKRRMMEVAVLLATGHMVEVIPEYLSGFTKEEKDKLYKILRVSSYDCFEPLSRRKEVVDPKESDTYTVICEGKKTKAVCRFVFDESLEITIKVKEV